MKTCRSEHTADIKAVLRKRIYRKIGIDCVRERPLAHPNAWTPERGERVLLWLGLDPLPTEADPTKFDPMAEGHWSILMALAWAMWRTPEAVRQHWAKYGEACMEWGGLLRGQRDYRRRKASRVLSLQIEEHHNGNDLHLSYNAAQAQLIHALGEGWLIATGRPPGRSRIEIPALEWPDMTFRSGPDRGAEDTFAADLRDGARLYEEVRFSRDDIVRLFKPIVVAAPQPNRMSRGGELRCITRGAELLRANPMMINDDLRDALAAEGFDISGEAWRRRMSKAIRDEPGVPPAKRGPRPKVPPA